MPKSAPQDEFAVKIGIVIPIYNVAKYLRECLDSVANQTYGNFCAVLVNDGSTDFLEGESTSQSLQIAMEYVANDSRFVLVDKKNGGLSSARNAGIEYFSGYNSFWGMQFRTCENFGESTDSSLVLSPKFSQIQKPHRHYFDCDSLHESTTNQAQDNKDSSLRGVANAEAIQNQNQIARSATLKALSGAGVGVVREGAGSDFAIQAPTPSLKKTRTHKKGSLMRIYPLNRVKIDSRFTLDSRDLDSSVATLPQNDESVDCHDSPLQNLAMTICADNIILYHNAKSTPNPPKIDYIIFLDSDDFWESDLLEKCVESAQIASEKGDKPDIVWFDWCAVGGIPSAKSMLNLCGFTAPTQISADEWLKIAQKRHIGGWWWAWSGLINFAFLREIRLRFLEGVIHEDHLFGLLLFAQSRRISILPQRLYNYRIRGDSITNEKQSFYPSAFSFCAMSVAFADFCDNHSNRRFFALCKEVFLPSLLVESCNIFECKCDEKGARAQLLALLDRLKISTLPPRIITTITRTGTLRYFLLLLYFNPSSAFFRTTRKILRALGFYRG